MRLIWFCPGCDRRYWFVTRSCEECGVNAVHRALMRRMDQAIAEMRQDMALAWAVHQYKARQRARSEVN